MRTQTLLFIVLLGLGVPGCRSVGPASQRSDRLVVTGSSTMAPLVSEIATRFESEHPNVRVDVQSGGSSRGIRDAISGSADIGLSSRALKESELQGVRTSILAWDGVTFIVHKDNPITSLSREQLVSIYTGKLQNWNEISSFDRAVLVSSRAAGRSELDLVTEYLGISTTQIVANVIDGETQQSIKTAATNSGAIVFTSIGAAQKAVEAGLPVKLLPLDGVAPTAESVASGEFPLARPLVFVQADNSVDSVSSAFIEFAMMPAMNEIAQELGFVSAEPSTGGEINQTEGT